MPSQKLTLPTSTALPAARKASISARRVLAPCTSSGRSRLSPAISWPSRCATRSTARSVVQSTKARPPLARINGHAASATCSGKRGSDGGGRFFGRYSSPWRWKSNGLSQRAVTQFSMPSSERKWSNRPAVVSVAETRIHGWCSVSRTRASACPGASGVLLNCAPCWDTEIQRTDRSPSGTSSSGDVSSSARCQSSTCRRSSPKRFASRSISPSRTRLISSARTTSAAASPSPCTLSRNASRRPIRSSGVREPATSPHSASASRTSRTARSKRLVSSVHDAPSGARASPSARASRPASISWPSDKVTPKKSAAIDGNWCASSSTTVSTAGRKSRIASSRIARSARNRW